MGGWNSLVIAGALLATLPVAASAMIPPHARFNPDGGGWICKGRFERVDAGCVATDARVSVQPEPIEARARKVAVPRRYLTRNGGECQDEADSGAEVCLQVDAAALDCQRSIADEGYSGCEVKIGYRLETDYRGRSSIQADVECVAEISYRARDGLMDQSESETDTAFHSLYSGDSQDGSFNLDFSFLSFSEVLRVEIEAVQCRIVTLSLR